MTEKTIRRIIKRHLDARSTAGRNRVLHSDQFDIVIDKIVESLSLPSVSSSCEIVERNKNAHDEHINWCKMKCGGDDIPMGDDVFKYCPNCGKEINY